MAGTISQRISFEGLDDIRKQLEELGSAGSKAFEEISKAAEDLGAASDKAFGEIGKAAKDTGLEKLGEAGEKAAEGIAKAGDASQKTGQELDKVKGAADQASESMSRLSLETVRVGSEIAKNAFAIAKTGVEIAQLVRTHESWIASLIRVAAEVNNGVRAVSLLAPILGTTALVLGATAVTAAGAAVAFKALGTAASAAAAPYEKLNHDLQMLAQSSGQSFDALQRGEALFTQIGVSAENFRGTIGKLAGEMGKLDVGAELQKSADSIVDANRKVLEAEKAVIAQRLEGRKVFLVGEDDRLANYIGDIERLKEIQAGLNSETDKARALEDALLNARQNAAVAAANSLSRVLEQVKAIAAGQQGITFDSLVTAETKLKAFAISLKQAADAGQNAGQVLVQFIATADQLSAIQVGKQFGLGEEQVDRIRRLGGHLNTVDAIWKRIQGAGVLIPPDSAAAFERMRTEIQATEQAWARLDQAWSSSVFARVGAEISAIVSSIQAGFINMAASVVESFNSLGGAVPLVAAIGTAFAALALIIGAIPAAIALVVVAIGAVVVALSGITWDTIASAGVAAWEAIVGAIQGAGTAVANFASSLAGIAWDAIKSAGVAAWEAITGAIKRAIDALLKFIGLRPSGSGGSGAAPAKGFARGGRIGGRGSGTSDSNLAWLSRGEYVMPASAVRKPGMLAFLEMLRRGGGIPGYAEGGLVREDRSAGVLADMIKFLDGLANSVADIYPPIMRGLVDVTDSIKRIVLDLHGALTSVVRNIEEKMVELIADLAQIEKLKQQDIASGHASGGLLGGRGSGTSDSNLAWVSRGEHIMPARAVRQPGMLAFLEMLRHSGGDLRRVLDGMGRFATGGLVPAMPSFAGAGGGVGGMAHLGTVDLRTEHGSVRLMASPDAVEQLSRLAVTKRMTSTGRKPSFIT